MQHLKNKNLLMIANKSNYRSVVRFLLKYDHNLDLDRLDDWHQSSLMLALRAKNCTIARMLLEAGATSKTFFYSNRYRLCNCSMQLKEIY